MSWWGRHAESIEAAAAAVTALVAVAALVGVKLQLDANDALARAQSARDAYRAHLALAVAHPEYAAPLAGCDVMQTPQAGAYYAFVDHLLYSAEQMLEVGEGWESTYLELLAPHEAYLCSTDGPTGDTDVTARLLAQYRVTSCPATPAC
ncbi:hypothetical protein ACS3SW_09430 [Roseobacteraceae bacterium S113]